MKVESELKPNSEKVSKLHGVSMERWQGGGKRAGKRVNSAVQACGEVEKTVDTRSAMNRASSEVKVDSGLKKAEDTVRGESSDGGTDGKIDD